MEFIKKRKTILTVTGIIVLFAIAGTVFFVLRSNPRDNKQKEGNQNGENYLSLSRPDRETADLYAELYEMSREDVARQQKKTGDWEKTAKELETAFFTIPENEKYQMAKQGYAPEDLEEAERLSTKTGRKAIELAKAKGKAADRRKWSQVVKDSEILTTEEQLGLTKEQVKALEKNHWQKKSG